MGGRAKMQHAGASALFWNFFRVENFIFYAPGGAVNFPLNYSVVILNRLAQYVYKKVVVFACCR